MSRKSIWEWTLGYVGDPASWGPRGAMAVEFLKEQGLTPQSRVLEIGCGNLSAGKPLIEYLAPGHYHGIEPLGLLVEAALERFPALESQAPRFGWGTDFDGSEFGTDFDLIFSHSVASHIAHWQLDQLLANTRSVVGDGAVFLCSYRDDQYNTLAENWAYPGVNRFRLATIQAAGVHFGWRVEPMPGYRERMVAVAPADEHQWLRLTAVPPPAALNDLRLEEEARIAEERAAHDAREAARREAHEDAERAAGIA